jgi:hypothetical protein
MRGGWVGRSMCAGGLFIVWLVLSGSPARGDERVVSSVQAGQCTLQVEVRDDWDSVRVRAQHPTSAACFIDAHLLSALLTETFAPFNPAVASRVFRSLDLGRLIDYPWLSQYLATRAAKDRAWNLARGQPIGVDLNRFVADLLSSREILRDIEVPLAQQGYVVMRASVEKVLVGSFDQVPLLAGPLPTGRIPFDAILWLRLHRRDHHPSASREQ